MYFYYGSETQPPCKEEVFWQVFAKPRSLSEKQFEFLKQQIVKKKDGSKIDETVTSSAEVYGNNRSVKEYDSNIRSPIKFSPIGSLGTTRKTT